MCPGIGIGIRVGSSGQSGSSYWTQQSEVLFFAYDSTDILNKVVGGQILNQKSGATDYLTVTGVGLNARYRTPNTAPYKAADTDYAFWKTDATESTCDGNRLIGYDFTRTIVFYSNTAPYVIKAIMILSSTVPPGAKENKMITDFQLPIYWNGTLSDYGYLKENRPIPERYRWGTSYANIGGTGDRSTIIDVTKSSGLIVVADYFPVHPALIDGHLINDYATYCAFDHNANIVDQWINFDFKGGARKVINEIKFYTGTYLQGVWQLKGSNEESATPAVGSFANIGTTFTLGPGVIQIITAMSENNTGYRHYRIVAVSGSVNSNGMWWEFEFKISE